MPESAKVLTVWRCPECGHLLAERKPGIGPEGRGCFGYPSHQADSPSHGRREYEPVSLIPLSVAEALAEMLRRSRIWLATIAEDEDDATIHELVADIDAALHTYRQSVPEREDSG